LRSNRRIFQDRLLEIAALFAIVWAVIRARVQSITMDEADTYFWYVATSDVWHPFSNNHVLNSLLMWISTRAFGTSSLAIRAPALLGAVLFVGTCYLLCRTITDRFSIQLPLFICLTYNPFVFDYMVAARGYGLADAFLLAAIAVLVLHVAKGRPSLRQACVGASLALGLSFTANFSFAFVDLAAFLAITAWAIRQRGQESVTRIVAYCALPGLFVALLVCGYPLAHWKKDDLIWGVNSLSEMRQSLLDSSLYRLDPRFQETAWYKAADFLAPLLPPLLAILCLCQIVVTNLDGSWRQDARNRWLGGFAAALAGIVSLSVLMHWLAFRVESLLLPVGRTGIFLVPLTTLLAGTIAAAPARTLVSRWLRVGITTLFCGLACYFLLCLRLSYFREYQWDADAKGVYSVLARYNHAYGITDVGMTGLFFPALNYYRMSSNKETLAPFKLETPNPPAGKSIYVMSESVQQSFIDKEKLVIVFRGNFTDVVVAVKPGLE
jgi:hypothetical protein